MGDSELKVCVKDLWCKLTYAIHERDEARAAVAWMRLLAKNAENIDALVDQILKSTLEEHAARMPRLEKQNAEPA